MMVRLTGARVLPQSSVAVQVSVSVPPQAVAVPVMIELLEVPEMRQAPVSPLVKGMVEGAVVVPQATLILAGAVMVGSAGGVMVMVLLPVMVRLHASVKVHVSVSVPPQAVGDPVRTAVTVPVIAQEPVSPLV